MESPVPEGHMFVLNIWLGVGSVVNRRLTYPVGDHYGFGLHDAIGRLVGGNIEGQGAGDAVIVAEQFQHGRVVDDTDASVSWPVP